MLSFEVPVQSVAMARARLIEALGMGSRNQRACIDIPVPSSVAPAAPSDARRISVALTPVPSMGGVSNSVFNGSGRLSKRRMMIFSASFSAVSISAKL